VPFTIAISNTANTVDDDLFFQQDDIGGKNNYARTSSARALFLEEDWGEEEDRVMPRGSNHSGDSCASNKKKTLTCQDRLKLLMKLPENQICVDCKDRRPQWASLIVVASTAASAREENKGSNAIRSMSPIGAFCCYECSGSHRRLGVHITFVRSVTLDSC